jgi:hypothetical protein
VLCAEDDLRQILSYRAPRKVTNALTVQYDRVMYLLEDSPANRALIHEYVEVVECRAYARACMVCMSGLFSNVRFWAHQKRPVLRL